MCWRCWFAWTCEWRSCWWSFVIAFSRAGRAFGGSHWLLMYSQLGVVGVVEDAWVGCPEGLSSDVLSKSGNSVVQLRFWECWLEAEFEAMPEEFCCAWGWWDGGAEVVETTAAA